MDPHRLNAPCVLTVLPSRQLAGLLAPVAGFAAGWPLSAEIPSLNRWLAFGLLYLLITLLVFGMAALARRRLERAKLEGWDNHLGLVLGAAQGCVFAVALTLIALSVSQDLRAIVTSTRSDIASAVVAAIGTLKGPLHGGAPSEVVDQLNQIGSADDAEAWVRETLARGDRLMGFGHRVYRAYDPRAAALRKVAEAMPNRPDWLQLAIDVEDVSLRVLAEKHPERPLKTNVEYYAAPVLMGVGLTPDLFPAAFSLARHAGWTAHILEQAADNRLIRPDVNYIGPAERDLPA